MLLAPMTQELELVVVAGRGAAPLRFPLDRPLVTLGAAEEAHVRIATLPREWAVLRADAAGAMLRLLASGETRVLSVGERVLLEGVELWLERPAVVDPGLSAAPLAEALYDARTPDEALSGFLDAVLRASSADGGAILLREGDDYRVAIARNADGTIPRGAEVLLSDTVVREVLSGGAAVRVGDAQATTRYANVPSVVAFSLRSVLCVPMSLHGKVLGAVFLGKRDVRAPLSSRVAEDVALIAKMAVPLLARLRAGLETAAAPEDAILGESAPMLAVKRLVARIAPTDLGVLISGETGTGKEVVARAIHEASLRRAKPMVAINCSAVPESLLAAELFGAKRGAFTGAVADRVGKIEQAHGSTLFLDEAGDMPLAMQAALLRVLEQREVVRVGENVARRVDFRLVCATHKDLDAEVRAGRFREDLLYRLREVTVPLPPLRERGSDVLLLARTFLRQTEHQLGLAPHELGDDVCALLLKHPWPGNVRELRATMRRAAVLADARALRPSDLFETRAGGFSLPPPAKSHPSLGDTSRPLEQAKDDFVRRYVQAAIERAGGDRQAAADALGISLRSLYRYVAR
jgi:transcriptional regulator with GAF, ATPase, and Fis domain